jgi:U-box domain
MSSKTDPFNRSPLTLDAVKPNTELKVCTGSLHVARVRSNFLKRTLSVIMLNVLHVQAKIDEWKAARRR